MKTLLRWVVCLIIIYIMVKLSSCKQEDPIPKPTIAGNWEFTSTNLSGNFVIKKLGEDFKVVSGTFTVKSHPVYNIYETSTVNSSISLINAFDKVINLTDLVMNSECTQIVSSKQSYNTEYDPLTTQYEVITINKIQ